MTKTGNKYHGFAYIKICNYNYYYTSELKSVYP